MIKVSVTCRYCGIEDEYNISSGRTEVVCQECKAKGVIMTTPKMSGRGFVDEIKEI